MSELLHLLVQDASRRGPSSIALTYRSQMLDYGTLWNEISAAAEGFAALGLGRGQRVGIYLDKRPETVIAMFATAAAGGAFVPINPILKPAQVGYIMRDCNVRLLVTSRQRASDLVEQVASSPDMACVIIIDDDHMPLRGLANSISWQEAVRARGATHSTRVIDLDMAAIFYTSGSTGNPKGVVLSHRNLVAGAKSVSSYLENVPSDRILSLLPLSFDAGFSQLTTAFAVGARVVLINYLLARDAVRAAAEAEITGLTGVPPLWIQLSEVDWPETLSQSLRYFANTGGHMPAPVLARLRALMPRAKPYLMYGLTEAFRSTYLDPSEVDR